MPDLPVVLGQGFLATKINSCALPIAGPANRVISDSFVEVQLSANNREAEEQEQVNAAGVVCVTSSTKPSRKWWNVQVTFCRVPTCLFRMILGWDAVLGYEGEEIGFKDQTDYNDAGIFLYVWAGVGDEGACEVPADDTIFAAGAAGTQRYTLIGFPIVRAQLGDFTVGAQVTTFTITGRTVNPAAWGRGPYNVVRDASDGNIAKRLAEPMDDKQHMFFIETTVPPPVVEAECCPLILPSPYFGPTAVDVAPNQPQCNAVGTNEVQTVGVGAATAGSYTLTLFGETTSPIAYNATPAVVLAALSALPSIGTGNVTVTGAAPTWVVTFVQDLRGTNIPLMVIDGTGLTGGAPLVTQTVQGGVY